MRAPESGERSTNAVPDWLKLLLAGLALGVLVLLYLLGTFDTTLYHLGINVTECRENLFTGEVLCGEDVGRVQEVRDRLR